MKLQSIASYVWTNAIEIEFGKKSSWDTDTFLFNWFLKYYPSEWVKGGASGLYWFLIKDKGIDELKQIEKPQNLPNNGTDIADITIRNEAIFQENLCQPDKDGCFVIYNGHEQNIFNRIRSHFALDNDGTTAIGFGKYDISQFDLRVRFFHKGLINNDLSNNEKAFIERLLNEKSGREAIESYWRSNNGWPVLCKR